VRNQPSIKIARFRGLVAGALNLSVSLLLGHHLPSFTTILGAAIVGVVCYGTTFIMYVKALHRLGAIRAIAYFSTAPLIGALLSIIILRETVTVNLVLAALFMSIGVWLHTAEKHQPEQPVYPF